MTTTLAILETMARQEADMEHSKFVGPDELRRMLQDSYGTLYDLLTAKNQDYYLGEPYEFTLQSSNKEALPSDFYKLVGVDVSLGGGRWGELDPFNFNERNMSGLRRRELGRYARVRYRVMGTSLHIIPADEYAGTYRLWYYPTCPDLVAVGSLDAVADKWREFIVVDSAIKMLGKEESDTSLLERRKAALLERIEVLSANVDVGRSQRIQDVSAQASDYDWEY